MLALCAIEIRPPPLLGLIKRARMLRALVGEGLIDLGAHRCEAFFGRHELVGMPCSLLSELALFGLVVQAELLETSPKVIACLLGEIAVCRQRLALLSDLVELALQGNKAVVEVRLGALGRERAVLRLDDLPVLLRQVLFETENLLVLLVECLTKI